MDFPTLAMLLLEHIPDGSIGYCTSADCDDIVIVIRDPKIARSSAADLARAQFTQSAIESMIADAEAS